MNEKTMRSLKAHGKYTVRHDDEKTGLAHIEGDLYGVARRVNVRRASDAPHPAKTKC